MKHLRKILAILILQIICSSMALRAESLSVQKFEGEIRIGANVPLDRIPYCTPNIMGNIALEVRYNLEDSPLDIGFLTSIGTLARDFHRAPGRDGWGHQENSILHSAISVDYNFRQGRKINPYAGLAFGYAFLESHGYSYSDYSGSWFGFTPRVGVEIAHFFRVSAEFNILRRGYNNFALTVGFVLGGRPKK